MNIMVVFDGTRQAAQNLHAALKLAHQPAIKPVLPHSHLNGQPDGQPKLLICVLETLREDKPLDDYLGEMERSTALALSLVHGLLAAAGPDISARIKVLGGMEPEAAERVTYEANQWPADVICLSLGQDCDACRRSKNRSRFARFFKSQRRSTAGEVNNEAWSGPDAYKSTNISALDVLKNSACPVYLTCHAERVYSLSIYHSQANFSLNEFD